MFKTSNFYTFTDETFKKENVDFCWLEKKRNKKEKRKKKKEKEKYL